MVRQFLQPGAWRLSEDTPADVLKAFEEFLQLLVGSSDRKLDLLLAAIQERAGRRDPVPPAACHSPAVHINYVFQKAGLKEFYKYNNEQVMYLGPTFFVYNAFESLYNQ